MSNQFTVWAEQTALLKEIRDRLNEIKEALAPTPVELPPVETDDPFAMVASPPRKYTKPKKKGRGSY